MVNPHLHILHLPFTPDDKINDIAITRLKLLMKELESENITDYTIVEGFYNPKNTKQSITQGHQLIVRLAKERGMDMVFIAEDDFVWSAKGAWQYFLSQIPKSFDLFFGVIYAGSIDHNTNRVLNGFSAGCSLYVVHSRFYDTFLDQPINAHVDRQLGEFCWKYEYYVCPKAVVTQRGGYSTNLKRVMFYSAYHEKIEFYKG